MDSAYSTSGIDEFGGRLEHKLKIF